MQKKLLKILLLMVVICAAGPALAQEPPLFTAIYWLKGTVSPPAVLPGDFSGVDGRTVVFYRSWPGASVTDVVGAGGLSGRAGEYMINILADGDLPIDPMQTYYAAVLPGPDGYGADPVRISISGRGFETVDFTLRAGGGPVPLSAAVPITIGREGRTSDLRISWTADAPPDIYYLLGNGTGRYTDDPSDWEKLDLAAEEPPTGFNFDLSEKYILHQTQFQTGSPEVYYKALVAGTGPDQRPSPGALTYLAQASAAGKINVTVAADGLRLLALPLEAGAVSGILPGQLTMGQTINLYPQTGAGLNKVKVTADGVVGADFNVVPGAGFWLENLNTAELTLTFLGAVTSQTRQDIAPLALTGNLLPDGIASADLGGAEGDNLYFQVGNGLTKTKRDGGRWRAFTLSVDQGLWYEHGTGTRNWQVEWFTTPERRRARIVIP